MRNILIFLLFPLLLVGCSALFLEGEDSQSDQEKESAETANSEFVDRPGYDSLPEGVADPDPLVTRTGGDAVKIKGEAIVQACNLITLEDLRGMGAYLNPAYDLSRLFFDGKGQGALSIHETSLPLSGDINACRYTLQDGKKDDIYQFVEVNLYHPLYVSPGAIQEELERGLEPAYKSIADVEGLKAYKREEDKNMTSYLIRHGDYWLNLFIQLNGEESNDRTLTEAILQTVAQRLKEEAKQPTGPSRLEIDSPAFSQEVVHSCDITEQEEIRQLFGMDAHPLVEEKWGSTVRRITFSQHGGDDTYYRYITNECKRKAAQKRDPLQVSSNEKGLRVKTTVYESEKPAELQMEFDRSEYTKFFSAEVIPLDETIGDEALYLGDADLGNPIRFRKGHVIVEVSFYEQENPDIPAQERIERLIPVVQDIAGRLK